MSACRLSSFVLTCLLCSSLPAFADTIGTFRWQLQPYCNVITLTVTQNGGVYTLAGTNDRCGAGDSASVVGIAFLNPSGSVGFGLTEVQPGGTAIHTEATITLASLNGTWRDSGGNTGTMIFTPGLGIGGSMRPIPAAGLAAGSITTVHIAPSAVGSAQLASNSVTGANIIDGTVTSADIVDAPRAVGVGGDQEITLSTVTDTVVRTVAITAPAAGSVIVTANGYFRFENPGTIDLGRCSITTGSVIDFLALIPAGELTANGLNGVPFSGTRTFPVTAGTTTYRLVCDAFSGEVIVGDTFLTALYVPGS